MATNSMLVIVMNGKRAELTRARKTYKCDECGWPIVPHSDYYRVIIGGGLGAIKFPDRVHVRCVEKYMRG